MDPSCFDLDTYQMENAACYLYCINPLYLLAESRQTARKTIQRTTV